MENLEDSTIESGSIIYNGNEVVEAEITLIEYNKELYKKEKFEKCREFKNNDTIKWIKVDGFSPLKFKK